MRSGHAVAAAGAPPPPPVRSRFAIGATVAVNALSRRLGRGSGTVVGGRVGLALDPSLVARLSAGRQVALVTGTNGKTTTTRLLAVALEAGTGQEVASNATGSNMPAGHAAALAAGNRRGPVVLEVDESYVPALVDALAPTAVVLLNLSRDQLDRTNEVRMLAGRWRQALGRAADTTVVANADDPMVAWGAGTAGRVVWVGAGTTWHADATGCPACDGVITYVEGASGEVAWSCPCGFARPVLDAWIRAAPDGTTRMVWADGTSAPLELAIPGAFNAANAAMAVSAAVSMGVDASVALGAVAGVHEVAGRFTTRSVLGITTRLMLAKNPAGWDALLGVVQHHDEPLVLAINARTADGRDPSWLWDVPFERLAGRTVVATGERRWDLAVRLRYAEVAATVVEHPAEAVAAAGGPGSTVEFIGNYTAFSDLLSGR
jgi:lipid II isoglutaminyl synthase (glutamine-hydrolysing)